jgi:hypothetical protein
MGRGLNGLDRKSLNSFPISCESESGFLLFNHFVLFSDEVCLSTKQFQAEIESLSVAGKVSEFDDRRMADSVSNERDLIRERAGNHWHE